MRTAEALKKAAGVLYPEVDVVILDTFRYASPLLEKVVIGAYMEMLKKTPTIYGYLYRQSECGRPLSGRGKLEFNRILNALAAPRLVEYVKDYRPDVIVCTHPFPLGIASRLKNKGIFRGQLFASITDFTIHSFWVFPEVDYYLVGSEVLIPQCQEYGIGPERVWATGIPIDTAFEKQYDKHRIKKQMGLDADTPAILLMGGGLGMGPLEQALKILDNTREQYQLIVVTGANKALQEKLNKMVRHLTCKVKVFGFVDNIHHLMAASDFMVGKAGGLTCAEAAAMSLPVLIIDPLPGQEERNTEFMAASGAGVRIGEKDLPQAVQEYLAKPDKLAGMACSASKIGKPEAAKDAIRIMVEAVNNSTRILSAGHKQP